MPIELVNPLNETTQSDERPAPRLESLAGKTIALLDISKRQGDIFLDRVEALLRERYHVYGIIRETKPTYTKPAPVDLLERLAFADGVIEALAD